jgi:hypothetical protein
MGLRYVSPDWALRSFDWSKLTPEALATMRAEAEQVDAENAETHKTLIAAVEVVADAIRGGMPMSCFGWQKSRNRKCKNAIAAMYEALPEYRTWTRSMDETLRRVSEQAEKERVEREQKASDEKRKREGEAKVLRAVEFLVSRGWTLSGGVFRHGERTWDGDALCLANETRKDELIAEKLKDAPIGFQGDDNCENCGGWDGESRRCECGNRRVGWSWDGDFENMYVYGEAW